MGIDRAELIAEMQKMPSDFGYFGDLHPPKWGWAPIAVHRDSDSLSRSNWEVITNDLMEKFPDAFEIEHSGHWAVGWINQLRVDTENEDALDALIEWLSALDDYPVASEDHWSEVQQKDKEESWDGWHCQYVLSETVFDEKIPGWDKLFHYGIEGRTYCGTDEAWDWIKWIAIDCMEEQGNSMCLNDDRFIDEVSKWLQEDGQVHINDYCKLEAQGQLTLL